MKNRLANLLTSTAEALKDQGVLNLDTIPPPRLEPPRDPAHGDWACNMALVLGKAAGMAPRRLAEAIVAALPAVDWLERVEVAGPGFINFFVKVGAADSVVGRVLEQGEAYGRNESGGGARVLLEFVSANPTGPLHVGHGRGAAYGASLAALLNANGYKVDSEYYLNDAGRQMDILAVSVWARYLQLCGEPLAFPANGYQGDYAYDIGAALHRQSGDDMRHAAAAVIHGLPADEPDGGDKEQYIDALIARCKTLLGADKYRRIHALGLQEITDNIRRDLDGFGVRYDTWFAESGLMKSDSVAAALEQLRQSGHIVERDGALWFKATAFGDEKDRVVRRENGAYTYFACDIAYHADKFARGYDLLINVWGADHHGYIARVKAALGALGYPAGRLEIMLVQFANLYRDGKQVKMSTRSGDFVTLRELRREVGDDAARFFYVTRRPEQHLDFDIDLAKSRSNENPVHYIQYAHARVSSVSRRLTERGLVWERERGLAALGLLDNAHERELIKVLGRYSELIERAGRQREPHQLSHYLRELAQSLHAYYNACPFLVEDARLRDARLCLIMATRQVLRNGLGILGVTAPEQM